MNRMILFTLCTIVFAEEKESTLKELTRRRADLYGVYAHNFKYGMPVLHVLTTSPIYRPSLVAIYRGVSNNRYGFRVTPSGPTIFASPEVVVPRRKPRRRPKKSKKKRPTVTKIRITKTRKLRRDL